MGILTTLMESRASRVDPSNPRDPGISQLFGLGSQTSAGVTISDYLNMHRPENTAMRLAAVYACVRVLAESVAQLPLVLYRGRKGGGADKATDHPAFYLLHDQPNADQTAMSFRESMTASTVLRGNGVAEILATGSQSVAGLRYLHPDQIRIDLDRKGRRIYEYTPLEPHEGTKTRVLLASEVLHIPGLSFDGVRGINPIQYQREAIGEGVAAQVFGSSLFANNAKPGGVLELDGTLEEPQIERLRKSWKFAQEGSNRVAVLEGGTKFHAITINPQDAQFLETRKYNRSEIAAIFRVPPHFIGDLEKATFSNIEQQALEFVQHSLMPWLVRWEQALNRDVLTERDRRLRYFFKFNVGGLLRGDAKARSDFYRAMFGVGAMSQNDIRALEELNPIEGGDVYYVPLNMVDAKKAKELKAQADANDGLSQQE